MTRESLETFACHLMVLMSQPHDLLFQYTHCCPSPSPSPSASRGHDALHRCPQSRRAAAEGSLRCRRYQRHECQYRRHQRPPSVAASLAAPLEVDVASINSVPAHSRPIGDTRGNTHTHTHTHTHEINCTSVHTHKQGQHIDE